MRTAKLNEKVAVLCPILFQALLYVVQLIAFPIFDTTHAFDILTGFVIICVTTTAVAVMGMVWLSDKYRYWLVGIVVYMLLLLVYRPYGISDGFWGVDIPLVTAMVLIIELIVWGIVKLIKRILNHC